ncbi:MmcQ/YjbR family DNA-binding protein [Chondromyces crocatus]|uniref:MmcQ/YjbR family DNA-binding protein n=1 Tax=Chondromyces crocatus TaxID=52 RepID=A0A0K1ETN0_CHOCO|nr:MmcQ/YjbR family DNA-binding protein [Chondromyces crocatus]AKT43988.1 uncharacterized protein CMC5_082260 [Chondromyces crocatus]
MATRKTQVGSASKAVSKSAAASKPKAVSTPRAARKATSKSAATSTRSPAASTPRRARKPLDLTAVRTIALAFPGAEEGVSYGTPAFRNRKKLFARLREDGESLVVMIDIEARDGLLDADPATFFITDHYRNYPCLLVRLAVVSTETLHDLLEQSWRRTASARQLQALGAASSLA